MLSIHTYCEKVSSAASVPKEEQRYAAAPATGIARKLIKSSDEKKLMLFLTAGGGHL